MASDLPEFRAESSEAMARVLVQYMACPKAIRSRLKEDFDRPPSLTAIERYRNEHLAGLSQPEEAAFKPHDGYWPDEAYQRANDANEGFIRRLRHAYPERFAA
jgi:hypothetical protein